MGNVLLDWAWSWWQGLEAGTGHFPCWGPPRPGPCTLSAVSPKWTCRSHLRAVRGPVRVRPLVGHCSSAAMSSPAPFIPSWKWQRVNDLQPGSPRLSATGVGVGGGLVPPCPSQHHIRLLPKHPPCDPTTRHISLDHCVLGLWLLIRTVPPAWEADSILHLVSPAQPAKLIRMPHV